MFGGISQKPGKPIYPVNSIEWYSVVHLPSFRSNQAIKSSLKGSYMLVQANARALELFVESISDMMLWLHGAMVFTALQSLNNKTTV